MSRPAIEDFRRAGDEPEPPVAFWLDCWYGRVAMLACTILLLTFSYAPYHQFYLAWIGLVPFLLMIRRTRSAWAAFWWGWGGGTAYFIANMWWLAYVTVPGMFALLGYLGLSWGVFAMIARAAGLLTENGKWEMENGKGEDSRKSVIGRRQSPPFSIFHLPFSIVVIATVWAGCEWFRGNYPFDGLPWLYLGHSQTPILVMCQIADVLGAAGVTFWVVLANAAVAMVWVSRRSIRGNGFAVAGVAGILIAIGLYGVFRMNQKTLSDGPIVMVVQADFPQSNETGKKGASVEEIVRFHLETTEEGLASSAERRAMSDEEKSDEGEKTQQTAGNNSPATDSSLIAHRSALLAPVDLVVWSETMMPDINLQARRILQGVRSAGVEDYGAFSEKTHQEIQDLALKYKVAMLVGGSYFDAWIDRQTKAEVHDNRNSAYYFDRTGMPAGRYDKIHLVPWGEFIPFKHSIPWLHQIFLSLSPYQYDYTLTPGTIGDIKIFELSEPVSATVRRFVVPICFEDIDAGLVAKMLRPVPGGNQQKRADFLVNITNDGWFKANQQPQHFQVAVFRCIENRVSMARSVNTGISGFIDPLGRVDASKLIPQYDEGYSVTTVMLDSGLLRSGDWLVGSEGAGWH
jgi:apolipoprotein N-acyltransferase